MKKIILKVLVVLLCVVLYHNAHAQFLVSKDSTGQLSGYSEAYYAYDFNKPADMNIPYAYNHSRHNEFNVNLMALRGVYNNGNIRAAASLAAGTYVMSNYAAEPDVMKHVLEAYAGVRIAKNLWMDAGIFSSHIGMESAFSKDCWTLTRSLSAENTPYFETGAKLTWSATPKWTFTGLVLNGWQNIMETNSAKAAGTQIQFVPNEHITLNSSTFIGNEKPDSVNAQMRYFHDLYGIFQITPKFGVQALFDYGIQQKDGRTGFYSFHDETLVLRYEVTNKFGVALRAEQYSDPGQVIVFTGTPNGLHSSVFSLNFDYKPYKNVWLRLEAKSLSAKDNLFIKEGGAVTNSNFIMTSSLAVSF